MRVALHFSDGSVAAYKLGRIVDGTHTDDLLTGKVTPVTDIASALAEQAKTEYPEATVVIERFQDNGDGTATWVPADESSVTPVPETTDTNVSSTLPVFTQDTPAPAVYEAPSLSVAQDSAVDTGNQA